MDFYAIKKWNLVAMKNEVIKTAFKEKSWIVGKILRNGILSNRCGFRKQKTSPKETLDALQVLSIIRRKE